MAQASRDQNSVPTLIAASSTDGKTAVPIYADPISHELYVTAPSSTYAANAIAQRDQNYVTTIIAISNVDGKTPVAVYADPVSNALFIQTP